jgi:hypothetical protein
MACVGLAISAGAQEPTPNSDDPYDSPPAPSASAAPPASAPPEAEGAKQSCLDAFKRAQRHRKHSELIAARSELLVCGQPSCPEVVVAKCVEWMEEVRSAIPTIIVTAIDHRGHDIKAAAIYVDDKRIASSLDGTPIDLDPGPHTLRLTHGERTKTQEIVAVQGTRNRLVQIRFDPPPRPPPPPPPGASVHVMSWVGFGIGAAGLLVGGITGAVALVKGRQLNDACTGGVCYRYQEDELNSGRALAHSSTVSLSVGGGGVLIGIAGLIAFPPGRKTKKSQTATVIPLIGPGSLALVARF